MADEGGKYREEYLVYAGRYGASSRTVKRWAALGRENRDLCPLDEPEKMRDWWARNMSQRVPDKLLEADIVARREKGLVVPDPPAAAKAKNLPAAPLLELPVVAKKEPPAFIPREFKPVGDEEVGLAATHRRLQEAEVQTHRIYTEALLAGNDAQAKLALKSFTDLASQVASVEQKLNEQRVKTRDLIPRLEAGMQLSDFHQDFHGMLRGFGDQFMRAFGVPVTAENDVVWQGLIDSVCEHLQKEVFEA